MKVTFYGTRGSIPVAEGEYVRVGGNTPCVFITFPSGRIAILDAGTGIRKLGKNLLEDSHEQFDDIVILLSHTHWDHIQGFPFFIPAYDLRRHFTIAICGKGRHAEDLENIFALQMQPEYFPTPLEKMGAAMTFWAPDVDQYETPAGVTIVAAKHNHPGDSYGYRIEERGRTLVYCTDVEHADGIDPGRCTRPDPLISSKDRQSLYRGGLDASLNYGHFDLALQFLLGQDDKDLWGSSDEVFLYGGFAELSFSPSTNWVVLARYDGMALPDDIAMGTINRGTAAFRYYFWDLLALHLEYSYRHQNSDDPNDHGLTYHFATARLDVAF